MFYTGNILTKIPKEHLQLMRKIHKVLISKPFYLNSFHISHSNHYSQLIYSSIQWGLGPTKISKTFSRPNSLKKVTFQTCELAFTPISLNLEQKNWCLLFVIMDWIPHKFQFVHWFFTELMKVIWINRCEFCEWKSDRQKKTRKFAPLSSFIGSAEFIKKKVHWDLT